MRCGWWASIARRASASTICPTCRRTQHSAAGLSHQGALGVPAGAPAAQGRARARSLRGPLVARVAPACLADADRVFVLAASAAAGRHRGKKGSGPPPHPSLPAIAAPAARSSGAHGTSAMSDLPGPLHPWITDESAKVVLCPPRTDCRKARGQAAGRHLSGSSVPAARHEGHIAAGQHVERDPRTVCTWLSVRQLLVCLGRCALPR